MSPKSRDPQAIKFSPVMFIFKTLSFSLFENFEIQKNFEKLTAAKHHTMVVIQSLTIFTFFQKMFAT